MIVPSDTSSDFASFFPLQVFFYTVHHKQPRFCRCLIWNGKGTHKSSSPVTVLALTAGKLRSKYLFCLTLDVHLKGVDGALPCILELHKAGSLHH